MVCVLCLSCRRYVLSIGGLQDVDYRTKTFSCSWCDSEGDLAVIQPIKEAGMQDYRSTQSSDQAANPAAVNQSRAGVPGVSR